MYPVPFDYEVAESTEHAIELLGKYGDEGKAHRRWTLPDPAHASAARRPGGAR